MEQAIHTERPDGGNHDANRLRLEVLALELEGATLSVPAADRTADFWEQVGEAALACGFLPLFELPPAMISPQATRAAVVKAGEDELSLAFVVLDGPESALRLVDPDELAESVTDFARSYAGVLGLLAGFSIEAADSRLN